MTRKVWMYSAKNARPNIPKFDIEEAVLECEAFIVEHLAPKWIQPLDHTNKNRMQLVDIKIKTIKNKFIFVAVYKDFRPDVISEDYESKFARIIMLSKNDFHIEYMRHTGEWADITFMAGNSLPECLRAIEVQPHFGVL